MPDPGLVSISFAQVLLLLLYPLTGFIGLMLVERAVCSDVGLGRWFIERLGLLGLAVLGFVLLGFGIMFPVEWSVTGLLPIPEFTYLAPDDGLVYIRLIDIMSMGALLGTAVMVVAVLRGLGVRLRALVLLVLWMSVIQFPLVGAWIWGGGWVDTFGASEYYGTGLTHVFPGIVFLVAAGMASRLRPAEASGAGPFSRWLFGLGAFLIWVSQQPTLWSWVRDDYALGRTLLFRWMFLGLVVTFALPFVLNRIRYARPYIQVLGCGMVGSSLWSVALIASDLYSMGAFLLLALSPAVVWAVFLLIDHWRISDPAGVIPVALVCGSLGIVSLGVFPFAPPHQPVAWWVQWAYVGSILVMAGGATAVILAFLHLKGWFLRGYSAGQNL